MKYAMLIFPKPGSHEELPTGGVRTGERPVPRTA